MSRRGALVATALTALLGMAACGSDDGAAVRSGSGSLGSGSGSGSGSGLSADDNSGSSSDPDIVAGIAQYRTYVLGQVADLGTATRAFTDAVRAGNLAQAQRLYAPSRVSWERIEPIAALIPDIDGSVDSRVDDFGTETNPDFTGWHKLEWYLFEQQTTDGTTTYADLLDADIATLSTEMQKLTIAPAAAALGAGDLVEEVSEGKIAGEEDRYSHTDLWDFDANIDGAQAVIDALTPALQKNDPDLLKAVNAGFVQVNDGLAPYALPEGAWKSYEELTEADKTSLKAALAALSEELAKVPAALNLS